MRSICPQVLPEHIGLIVGKARIVRGHGVYLHIRHIRVAPRQACARVLRAQAGLEEVSNGPATASAQAIAETAGTAARCLLWAHLIVVIASRVASLTSRSERRHAITIPVRRAVARSTEPVVYVRVAPVCAEQAHAAARLVLVAPLRVDQLLAARHLVHVHQKVNILVHLALLDFDLLKDGVLVHDLLLDALVLPHVVHNVRQTGKLLTFFFFFYRKSI